MFLYNIAQTSKSVCFIDILLIHFCFLLQSLLLLNYLVRNGSERVVTSSREHIYDLRSLENYTCIDEFGKDQGINIRHKVRELIDFIQDDDKLREERKKAKKNKDKYVGLSSEAMGMRFGGGDRWMDNPKWNKSGVETYNDWDNNRGKGFEDANNRCVSNVHFSNLLVWNFFFITFCIVQRRWRKRRLGQRY